MKDICWFRHLVLNSVAGTPTYVSEFAAVVMVAWYTTWLTKHSPFKGNLFGSLQLQGLGVFHLQIAGSVL